MENLSAYADRPIAFFWRYVRAHRLAHAVILACVATAVLCSVMTQYGVKLLIDTLSQAAPAATGVWLAFGLLVALIAADNLLWRLASWVGHSTFVAVTGDARRDLFRHLTGHAPSYFASRSPGTLTSRITATSNALFTVENMLVWNVLPPCLATVCAIGFVGMVSWWMAASLVVVGGLVVVFMFRRAAAGKPLHHAFADRAAAVDGEMTDVVGNMTIVRAFGGLGREHRRFDDTVEQEMAARRQSLYYLERLRIAHALVTVVLTIALLAWAIVLWQHKAATIGDVILVCTLGLSVLHATRDLAVALVDVTQHLARFSEALSTLLVPHQMCDYPGAARLVRRGASVTFEKVSFAYPDCPTIFENLSFDIGTGQRVGSGRRLRRRQVHHLRPGAALLRHPVGPHPDQRPGRHAGDAAEPARGHRGGAAGHLAVPSHADREHPLCPTRGSRRRGVGGRESSPLLRVHREAAAGSGHAGRRSRRPPVGRAAAAHRHRPRLPEERAPAAAR